MIIDEKKVDVLKELSFIRNKVDSAMGSYEAVLRLFKKNYILSYDADVKIGDRPYLIEITIMYPKTAIKDEKKFEKELKSISSDVVPDVGAGFVYIRIFI